jgi:hypothetical protein
MLKDKSESLIFKPKKSSQISGHAVKYLTSANKQTVMQILIHDYDLKGDKKIPEALSSTDILKNIFGTKISQRKVIGPSRNISQSMS